MSEQSMTTRARFVDRVRQALRQRGQGGEPGPPPGVDDATARIASDDQPLGDLFVERAEALGMAVTRCEAATLGEAVAGCLAELEARRVVMSVAGLEQAAGLEAALADRGIEIGDWRNDPTMAAAFAADAGITGVRAAIAETGSLVYASGAEHGRGLMLAPPAHLAIVRRSDLLPDLLDHARRLDGADPAVLPAGEVIISGPSKTADIEGVLITGVHGPGKLLVVFVEDA